MNSTALLNSLLILLLFNRSQIADLAEYDVARLTFNTAALADDMTLAEAGIVDESSINALLVLDGGKRKRKKKVYTKPKRVAHKHKKRPKALLEYYSVESSGKIKKLKSECGKCLAGKLYNYIPRGIY